MMPDNLQGYPINYVRENVATHFNLFAYLFQSLVLIMARIRVLKQKSKFALAPIGLCFAQQVGCLIQMLCWSKLVVALVLLPLSYLFAASARVLDNPADC